MQQNDITLQQNDVTVQQNDILLQRTVVSSRPIGAQATSSATTSELQRKEEEIAHGALQSLCVAPRRLPSLSGRPST